MLACRISSMLLASTSIVVLLVALTTDYWLVAYGPKHVAHSGLWMECRDGTCFTPKEAKEYIIATRLFLILGSLAALASALCSASSFMSCPYSIGNNSVVTSFIAFAAGLFTLTALAVYTAESWDKNQDPQIQLTFAWSFYFGWVAVSTLLLTGIFSLIACLYSPRADYERL